MRTVTVDLGKVAPVMIALGLGLITGVWSMTPERTVEAVKPLTPTITAIEVERKPEAAVSPDIWNISGYCKEKCCCEAFADGFTADGHKIKRGDRFIAAPKGIPFGTIIDVPGYGKAVVRDRGGAIKNKKLDLYFCELNGVSGHKRALQWGRKHLAVKFIEK